MVLGWNQLVKKIIKMAARTAAADSSSQVLLSVVFVVVMTVFCNATPVYGVELSEQTHRTLFRL